ncbi:SPK domain-containing protein [Caenorhabditis elegans]|nr:SPK domain-containing protein [Caenorhabditis elegans]CBK55581.1 SPK domain-containing protein [Caenorhabditis elegans]|eukprot:NP_001255938.1 Uncharacterized protein CELE_C49C3.8 [Caenorhabditis elegans]
MKDTLGFEHADRSLYYRFRNSLSSNLHLTHFDIETKLEVAKKFNLILNDQFVKDLNSTMNLIFEPNGCLASYTWKTDFLDYTLNPMELIIPYQSVIPSKTVPYRKRRMNDLEDLRKIKECSKRAFISNSDQSEVPSTSMLNSMKEMITEAVETSNKKLIEELKTSNEALVAQVANFKSKHIEQSSGKPGMRAYLEGLKGFLHHLNMPELADIKVRLNTLEKDLGDTDQPIPVQSIHSVLDIGLKLIGG